MLIKEKEKLFLELKTILARQPGNEIYNQLEIYKQNIKEKSGQMKQMLFELDQVQDKVIFLSLDKSAQVRYQGSERGNIADER